MCMIPVREYEKGLTFLEMTLLRLRVSLENTSCVFMKQLFVINSVVTVRVVPWSVTINCSGNKTS